MIYHFFPAHGCSVSLSIERALGRSCWIKFDSNLSETSSLARRKRRQKKADTRTVFTCAFFDHAYNQRDPSAGMLIDNFVMRDEGTPLTPNWSFDIIRCWVSIKPTVPKKSCASFDSRLEAGGRLLCKMWQQGMWIKFYLSKELKFDANLRWW